MSTAITKLKAWEARERAKGLVDFKCYIVSTGSKGSAENLANELNYIHDQVDAGNFEPHGTVF